VVRIAAVLFMLELILVCFASFPTAAAQGPLDHFAFDTIESPQTVGVAFSITITDAYVASVCSFFVIWVSGVVVQSSLFEQAVDGCVSDLDRFDSA
jgi:hypothetical protein